MPASIPIPKGDTQVERSASGRGVTRSGHTPVTATSAGSTLLFAIRGTEGEEPREGTFARGTATGASERGGRGRQKKSCLEGGSNRRRQCQNEGL